MSALLIFAAAEAAAQQPPVGGGPRINLPRHSNHFSWEGRDGFHGGFGGVWIVEREVPVFIERETPPPPAAAPLPEEAQGGAKAPPRKPYVIGASYASLPGGCMKLIDEGVSYYYCSGGEWYRQIGGGRDARYRAVAKP